MIQIKRFAWNQCLLMVLGPRVSMQNVQVLRKRANVNEGSKDIRRRQKNQPRHHSAAAGRISTGWRMGCSWDHSFPFAFIKSCTKPRGLDAPRGYVSNTTAYVFVTFPSLWQNHPRQPSYKGGKVHGGPQFRAFGLWSLSLWPLGLEWGIISLQKVCAGVSWSPHTFQKVRS